MILHAVAVALALTAVVAEPPVNNGYLPPAASSNNGYNYPRPQNPFPPAPRPTYSAPPAPSRPSYSPPPPQPTYGAPPQPSYAPPSRPPPPPPPRPTYGAPAPPRPSYAPPSRPPPPPPPRPTYGAPTQPSYAPPSPPRPTYGPPGAGTGINGVSIAQDTGAHDHSHDHHEPGMPFDFNYAVKDEYGNDYSHNAVSDGDVTRGEYRIALPDGRTQIVTYVADWKTGFNADVKYEGEARYPDQPLGAPSGGYNSIAPQNSYGAPPATGSGPY